MTRIFTRIAFGAAAALVLGLHANAAEDPTSFDVLEPLTGGGAFLGGVQKQNIGVTEKMINEEGGLHGKQIHFVFHDDQTSPQTAVQLTSEILANHPPVVFGSTISGICNAMTPLMQDGPVHYCFSPSVRPKAAATSSPRRSPRATSRTRSCASSRPRAGSASRSSPRPTPRARTPTRRSTRSSRSRSSRT